jgi:GT2 family glycosyltransferase
MTSFENITACILSYNRREDLRRTLNAVLAIEGLRVMVIDNASTDGTAEMLTTEFVAPSGHEEGEGERVPPVAPGSVAPGSQAPGLRPGLENAAPSGLSPSSRPHALTLNTNIGIAARNIFIDEVETEFLLTLDDDSWPRSAEDVLRMLRTMESDPRIASVCAACIHPDTGKAETAGIERFATVGSADDGYDVVNIAAGGSLLRMEALRETRGYGEEFFWGREENDLAFQLLLRGWRVVYDPRAVIWHTLSPAGRRVYERLRYITRNSLWLLWKYFPLPVALPVSLLFVLRRILPILKDPRRAGYVFRGIASGYAGMAARRRLAPDARRFTLRESRKLRGWFFKLLYE